MQTHTTQALDDGSSLVGWSTLNFTLTSLHFGSKTLDVKRNFVFAFH